MDLLFGSTSAGLVIRRPCDLDGRAAPLRGAARVRDTQPSLCSGTRSPGPRESSTADPLRSARVVSARRPSGRTWRAPPSGRTWRAIAWDGTASRWRCRSPGSGPFTPVSITARASRWHKRPAGRASVNRGGPDRGARRSTVPSGDTGGWPHKRLAAQAAGGSSGWRRRAQDAGHQALQGLRPQGTAAYHCLMYPAAGRASRAGAPTLGISGRLALGG
jgi:hypothetical protein